jgi:hypothetical protein
LLTSSNFHNAHTMLNKKKKKIKRRMKNDKKEKSDNTAPIPPTQKDKDKKKKEKESYVSLSFIRQLVYKRPLSWIISGFFIFTLIMRSNFIGYDSIGYKTTCTITLFSITLIWISPL